MLIFIYMICMLEFIRRDRKINIFIKLVFKNIFKIIFRIYLVYIKLINMLIFNI